MPRPNPRSSAAASRRLLMIFVTCAALLLLTAGALLGYALRYTSHGGLASLIGGKFTLVDQNGRPFTQADLRGKWELVFFGYTHCPDVCPTTLNDLSLAFDKLPPADRGKIGVVFISVDPARDTPAVLKDYIASFSAPVTALTGTPAEIAQAAKDYRVYYAKHPTTGGDYEMDHSALIYVMDPKGRFTASFTPADTGNEIAERLEKLLS